MRAEAATALRILRQRKLQGKHQKVEAHGRPLTRDREPDVEQERPADLGEHGGERMDKVSSLPARARVLSLVGRQAAVGLHNRKLAQADSSRHGFTGRPAPCHHPLRVDAVGKVGFSIGVAFWGADAAEMSRLLWFEVAGSGSDLHATDAITINAQASDARRRVGGGPRIRSASVLRFCTMAAR